MATWIQIIFIHWRMLESTRFLADPQTNLNRFVQPWLLLLLFQFDIFWFTMLLGIVPSVGIHLLPHLN